jgi:hypothetical protein
MFDLLRDPRPKPWDQGQVQPSRFNGQSSRFSVAFQLHHFIHSFIQFLIVSSTSFRQVTARNMAQFDPAPTAPPRREPARKSGCYFYGCLIFIVLLVFSSLAFFFGARYALHTTIERYTEPRPGDLPQAQVSDAELREIRDRVQQFQTALEQNQLVPPLILTDREINALIATDPDLENLRNKVFVTIKENEIQGLISIPLEEFSTRFFKGRYLNGAASFNVGLSEGNLHVTVQSAEVKGEPIPEQVLERLRQENLARDVNTHPEASEVIRRLENIEVSEGRLILTPKAAPER